MKVYNRTRNLHIATMGMDVAGREYLVFVVKGSFAFPKSRSLPSEPLVKQTPFVTADQFTGAPGYSATRWESDFAFRKTRCDVVIQAAAYAPDGTPAERVPVGVKVGTWSKVFQVVGHREWVVLGPSISATRPYPFTRQEFGYDSAFGGPDRLNPDDVAPPVCLENPIGRGFATVRHQSRLSGSPLPNTEETGVEVTSPYGEYRPMALGPVSRAVPRRVCHAGTYDQAWQDNVFPFLPADFDERYFQQVGEDQQIDPPTPGTEVVLLNLTARGREAFKLPDTVLPLSIFRGRETAFEKALFPDTLLIDCEARQFSLVWRAQVPMRRLITEFTEAWIGPPSRGLVRARRAGKRYVGREDEPAALEAPV